jgi:hypothetical protein
MLPPPRCLSGAVVDTPLRTLLYFTYPHTYYLRACRSPSWSRLSGPARHFLLEGLTMSAGSADAEPGTLASNEASVRRLLERERSLLIGAWRVGAAGVKTFPVVSPTVRKSSRTPRHPGEDVAQAVASASHAFPDWSRRTPGERAALVFALTDEIEQRVRDSRYWTPSTAVPRSGSWRSTSASRWAAGVGREESLAELLSYTPSKSVTVIL